METMTLSGFGRLIGHSPEAISKAVKRGRLTEKSVQVIDGRPVVIDIEQARREWMSNAKRPRLLAAGSLAVSNRNPEYIAARASVCRTRDYVAIQLLEGSEKVPIEPPDTFIESVHVATSFSTADDDYFLYALTPHVARELARLLLLMADTAPTVEKLPG